MKLTPIMQKYILHWGEMGTRWGVNRTVSQIHALLYLATAPLPADEITDTLSVARSNVSASLKELQNWGIVRLTHVMGDRRDHFEAVKDNWQMLMVIIEERKRRELDPTLVMLNECVDQSERDTVTDPEIKRRIRNMLEFTQTLNAWSDQMTNLPRPTLIKLMKMGSKIAKLIP